MTAHETLREMCHEKLEAGEQEIRAKLKAGKEKIHKEFLSAVREDDELYNEIVGDYVDELYDQIVDEVIEVIKQQRRL